MSATLVQSKTKAFAGGTSTTLTLDASPTPGNVLVLTWGTSNGTSTSGTPTGGGCTTWTKRGESAVRRGASIWTGVVDTTPSANVVMPGTVTMLFTVTEWSGLDSGSLLHGSAVTGSAVGTTASGANVAITPTASAAVVLIMVAGTQGNTTGGPSAGWTSIQASGSVGSSAYQIVASASGAYSNKYNITNDYTQWDAVVVALNVAAAGTPAVASRGIHAL